jgi:hypothetical protein
MLARLWHLCLDQCRLSEVPLVLRILWPSRDEEEK